MSEFVSSTFGLISGRHGSAVAMKSKSTGKNYLRLYSTPSDPKTTKQIAQRAKFGFVVHEMNCFHNLFKITFGGNQGVYHGISLAFKAVTGEYPNYSIDFTKLIISSGSLDVTGNVTAEKTVGTTVKVDWDTTIGFQSHEDDGVNLVFMNELNRVGILKQNIAMRNTGDTTVELPAIWANLEIHCWLFFTTPDGSVNSDSQYIGTVQL